MIMIWTYAAYLLVSVGLTVWVGRTLHRNGRIFLIDAMHGNDKLADAVNHLLLVGFYLVNIGFMALALKYGGQVLHVQGAIEYLSTKLGIVLLVLGGMHFFNLAVLSGMRRRAVNRGIEVLPAEVVDDRGYRGRLRTGAVPVDR